MTRHLALLRGINVGGKNRLPMAALAEIVSGAGGDAVRTYIQSGNVLFDAPASHTAGIASRVSEGIEAGFGFRPVVVVRSLEQMRAVVRANPFLARGAAPDMLHVVFLDRKPDAARARRIDPRRSPPDELELVGREIYLRLPGGVAKTKITNAYLDATLAVTSTMRNWRTVTTLLDLMGAP